MKQIWSTFKKPNKKQLYGILTIGILLLVFSSGMGDSKEKTGLTKEQLDYQEYELYLEQRLEKMLNRVVGISDSEIMVVLENGMEHIPAYETADNTFGDIQPGQDRMIVLKKQGGEEAFVLKERFPTVKGVLVIAKGAGNSEVERNIVEAIKTVFDISSNRVKVLEKQI